MSTFEDKISLMIPAYLRGELSDDERLEIENLAASNPDIAADIEFQRNLKSTLKSDETAFEPGELGWAKLSKAMETHEAVVSHTQARSKFWPYAAAVLGVMAIGQAGVLGSMTFNKIQSDQYVTASEHTITYNTVKLGFKPESTSAQLISSLQSVDGKIIAGPSSLGLYQVQFVSQSACLTAIDTLQKQTSVIDTISSCE